MRITKAIKQKLRPLDEEEMNLRESLISSRTIGAILSSGIYPKETWKEIHHSRFKTAIANRWVLGFPHRVIDMVQIGVFDKILEKQEKLETKALMANYMNLSHLSEIERIQMSGISLDPPFPIRVPED